MGLSDSDHASYALARDRYEAYEPILKEVEKILAEAGLDEEDMRNGAKRAVAGNAAQTTSQNSLALRAS